jgi:hypothetical protein
MFSLLPAVPLSRHRSARYTVADIFPASSGIQSFVLLVQFGASPVMLTHLSLTVIVPGGNWALMGVVVPSDTHGRLSYSPMFYLGPDPHGSFLQLYTPSEDLLLYGLQTQLDPVVSRCGHFVGPASSWLALVVYSPDHNSFPFSFSYNAASAWSLSIMSPRRVSRLQHPSPNYGSTRYAVRVFAFPLSFDAASPTEYVFVLFDTPGWTMLRDVEVSCYGGPVRLAVTRLPVPGLVRLFPC